jgi:hypothetical protein
MELEEKPSLTVQVRQWDRATSAIHATIESRPVFQMAIVSSMSSLSKEEVTLYLNGSHAA